MSTRQRAIPHAAGWASEQPTPAQLKDLFAQVEAGSPNVTRERMQLFLRGKLVNPATLPAPPPPSAPNPLLDELSAAFQDVIPDFADQAIELVRPFCAPDLDLELRPYTGPDQQRSREVGTEEFTRTRCQAMLDSIPGFNTGFGAMLIIVGQGTNRYPYCGHDFIVESASADDAIRSIRGKAHHLDDYNKLIFDETLSHIKSSFPKIHRGVFGPLPCYQHHGLVGHLRKRLHQTGALIYRQINSEYLEAIADHIVDLLRTAIVMMVVGHDERVKMIKAMLAAQVSGHPFLHVDRTARVVYFLARPY